jgi:hypothetical protein
MRQDCPIVPPDGQVARPSVGADLLGQTDQMADDAEWVVSKPAPIGLPPGACDHTVVEIVGRVGEQATGAEDSANLGNDPPPSFVIDAVDAVAAEDHEPEGIVG